MRTIDVAVIEHDILTQRTITDAVAYFNSSRSDYRINIIARYQSVNYHDIHQIEDFDLIILGNFRGLNSSTIEDLLKRYPQKAYFITSLHSNIQSLLISQAKATSYLEHISCGVAVSKSDILEALIKFTTFLQQPS